MLNWNDIFARQFLGHLKSNTYEIYRGNLTFSTCIRIEWNFWICEYVHVLKIRPYKLIPNKIYEIWRIKSNTWTIWPIENLWTLQSTKIDLELQILWTYSNTRLPLWSSWGTFSWWSLSWKRLWNKWVDKADHFYH